MNYVTIELGGWSPLETLRDLAVQQHELQRNIAGVEPFGDLVLPGEPLGLPDLQGSSTRTTGLGPRKPTHGGSGHLHQSIIEGKVAQDGTSITGSPEVSGVRAHPHVQWCGVLGQYVDHPLGDLQPAAQQ